MFLVSLEKESPLAGAEREGLGVLYNRTPGACAVLAKQGHPRKSDRNT